MIQTDESAKPVTVTWFRLDPDVLPGGTSYNRAVPMTLTLAALAFEDHRLETEGERYRIRV